MHNFQLSTPALRSGRDTGLIDTQSITAPLTLYGNWRALPSNCTRILAFLYLDVQTLESSAFGVER